MPCMKKVIYEPHPITPERKAELRAAGFRIIDARFAPKGETSVQAPAAQAPRKARKGKGKE